MTLNWNSCPERCGDELRETTTHLCKGSEHRRHGCFHWAEGELVRWFPVLRNYLTANAKSGFSSLQDGEDGRWDSLSKERVFHQWLLKMCWLCGGRTPVSRNMGQSSLEQIPMLAEPSRTSFPIVLLICSATATLALFLLLEHARDIPASGPLHMLFLLPGTFPLDTPWVLSLSNFSSNIPLFSKIVPGYLF